jgi:hypothetical protein
MHNLINKKFNRLLPIIYMGESKWRCQCDCGNITIKRAYDIERGRVKSCGCLLAEIAGNLNRKPPGVSAAHGVFCTYRKGASNRGYEFDLTEEEVLGLIKKPCSYCGKEPHNERKSRFRNGNFLYNGIDRIDNSRGYTKDNVVQCCRKCNEAKKAMSRNDFINWVISVYEYSVGGK